MDKIRGDDETTMLALWQVKWEKQLGKAVGRSDKLRVGVAVVAVVARYAVLSGRTTSLQIGCLNPRFLFACPGAKSQLVPGTAYKRLFG